MSWRYACGADGQDAQGTARPPALEPVVRPPGSLTVRATFTGKAVSSAHAAAWHSESVDMRSVPMSALHTAWHTESAICLFRKAQAPLPWSHCAVPGVMRPTAAGSSQSLVRLIEENDTENDQGVSWQLSAAVLGPGGENIWTFRKSHRIGGVAACQAGFAGTPVTGGLLHFPVLPIATPPWAGPDVPGPAKRPVSGLSVARRARVASRSWVTVPGP